MNFYNQLEEDDLTISFNPKVRGYNYDMFSGIDYKVDITKPAGQRIINPMINGNPLDPQAKYRLAVNNYRFGTISTLGLVNEEDKYYDSSLETVGTMRDLIIKYVTEEQNGLVTPKLDGNWEIINYDFNNPLLEKLAEKIKDGSLSIPKSEDGRTLNVKSIKIQDVK
ncbi:5'-nucleotidase C-terminal domain-containing protein [Streptobacillus felis]